MAPGKGLPLDSPKATMLLQAAELHLELVVEGGSPRLTALLERRWSEVTLPLRRWGCFARPVTLTLLPSVAALRAAAPRPSVLDLRGVAWLDRVWLLAPENWPFAPDDPAVVGLVVHELAHVLWFQRSTAPGRLPAYAPTWFREGVAVLAAQGAPDPRERRNLAQLPVAALAYADDVTVAEHGEQVYQVAAFLTQTWLDHQGSRGYASLCRELRSGRGFAEAFRRVCGEDDRHFAARIAEGWTQEALRR